MVHVVGTGGCCSASARGCMFSKFILQPIQVRHDSQLILIDFLTDNNRNGHFGQMQTDHALVENKSPTVFVLFMFET